MNVEQQLLALEKQFWTGNADFYRQNVDTQCLVAFTEMSGLMTNEQVASTIKEGQRMSDIGINKDGIVQLGDNVAILTYHASAKRPNGDPYKAIVSSGYVRRDGSWKMAFHHQTPLAA